MEGEKRLLKVTIEGGSLGAGGRKSGDKISSFYKGKRGSYQNVEEKKKEGGPKSEYTKEKDDTRC